jgi:hypothetical protein
MSRKGVNVYNDAIASSVGRTVGNKYPASTRAKASSPGGTITTQARDIVDLVAKYAFGE